MSAVTSVNENQRLKKRQEISISDCWNVEVLYPSWEAWEEDLAHWGKEADEIHWPEILVFKEKWHLNPKELALLLDQLFAIDRALSKLYTYAHLRHDEDVSEDRAKGAYGRMLTLLHAFKQETSWIEPALLKLPDAEMELFLASPDLEAYRVHIKKVIRYKPHTLSEEQERLLALSGNALETAHKAFSSLNNADMKFPSVLDKQGQERELTHGKYSLYLQDADRLLRKNSFQQWHQTFLNYENTFCELLQGQIQSHLFHTKARQFSSCLEAALFPHEIDPQVYTALIASVKKHLPKAHRYMGLRKKIAGLDLLHLYDLHMPLIPDVQINLTYEEACEHIVASVSVLGEIYQAALQKGLTVDRWVDRYENQKKRSGAYSSGCYDSMPYILMNYNGSYRDVMTLTHEAGHSMHSLLSKQGQPYQYSQYPIFVAEVASTFHEELLFRHFLLQFKKPEEQAFLINQKIDDIRTTLLRQTMFAEFELQLHSWAEKGVPFTPSRLKETYRRLNEEYFGPEVHIDKEIDIEWARIPHFYYNFYVYQYATGLSAAHTLAEKVLSGDPLHKQRYLEFLSAGCSRYPIDLLKSAGVDMTTGAPVEAAMRGFDVWVTRLCDFLDSHPV